MAKNKGEIIAINGNMIQVRFKDDIIQNEVGYVLKDKQRLKSEVIKIERDIAFLQVFETTKSIKVGDKIEFSGQMLSVQLGPGLLSQIYDGLQNPLPELASKFGFFLPVGVELGAISLTKKWKFKPYAKKGDRVIAGSVLGHVHEGIFKHNIMVPFYIRDECVIDDIALEDDYAVDHTIAKIKKSSGETVNVSMVFDWPVKIPITAYADKLAPKEPLSTRIRIIDTFFPVAKGGTYCIPGPFGAGKTVLQQLTSRYAEIDIVVIAACGERAGEVVETLREFPKLKDPRTGKVLMDRTIIICNTSSMPVAARESSVYTAATIAEYYRQMGLNVLLLADSTSRWAQAMREISGRLEEIPGEEAYPAYLESRIAQFYERAGIVKLHDGSIGSLTIGGTVSPAGGSFEEPVTQATLKVVGAFHGLSRDRADARKFPSVDPLESWSKYASAIQQTLVDSAKQILFKGDQVNQMMKVVGEEGTSSEDFEAYLKSEFLDVVYMQQNGFDPVDSATSTQRQEYVFSFLVKTVLERQFLIKDKQKARQFFYGLRQAFIDWNYAPWDTQQFKQQQEKIESLLKEESYAKSMH
ncbi:MAG: V-type ATP synthase subunit A [Candidatus Orphnella occulta]|nr:V-type ATP synthase subunit A [Candidatus Orphnella occulta]